MRTMEERKKKTSMFGELQCENYGVHSGKAGRKWGFRERKKTQRIGKYIFIFYPALKRTGIRQEKREVPI